MNPISLPQLINSFDIQNPNINYIQFDMLLVAPQVEIYTSAFRSLKTSFAKFAASYLTVSLSCLSLAAIIDN